jgi:hypothetical protein
MRGALFLTDYQGIAWILEYMKLAREKCVWDGKPSHALPSLTPPQKKAGICRDQAITEETCAKRSPYSFVT